MSRLLLGLTLLAVACQTNIAVNPAGYLCDPGNACPSGYQCQQGVCQSLGTDGGGCAGTTCDAPPASTCVDASTQRTYSAPGTCNPSVGTCSYPHTDTACPFGCAGTQCQAAVCTGNQGCQTPPPPSCLDGTTLRTWDAGTCNTGTGSCVFPPLDVGCARCQSGACVPLNLTFAQTDPALRRPVTAVDQVNSGTGSLVLAVGAGGLAALYDGTGWKMLDAGTTEDLTAAWLASPTLGYVVGTNATLLKFDGSALAPSGVSGLAGNLVDVHGVDGNHVLVAAQDGHYWRYDGANWSTGSLASVVTTLTTFSMSRVFVDAAGHERIAGYCDNTLAVGGCVAYAPAVAGTFRVDQDAATGQAFTCVGPPVESGDLAMIAAASVRRHLSTGAFDSLNAPPPVPNLSVVAIAASSASAGAAADYLLEAPATNGPHAELYRFTHTTTNNTLSDPLWDFLGSSEAMARSEAVGGIVIADADTVGQDMVRLGGTSIAVLDLDEPWRAAAAIPGGGTALINAYGSVAWRAPTGVTFGRSPSTSAVYKAVSAGTNFAVLAGATGKVARWSASGGFTPVSSGSNADLNAVCRISDTAFYIVGQGGRALLYDGNQLTPMTAGSANLNALACSTGASYAVGEGSSVLRQGGSAWSPVVPAYPDTVTFTSAAVDAVGVLYVAGDGVFARLQNGAWQKLPTYPGLTNLLVFGPSEAYALSTASSATAVVKFDGASWQAVHSPAHPLYSGVSLGNKALFAGDYGVVVLGQ